jgi:Uma2 family endonuclease
MIAERVHGPLWTVEQYLEMERWSPIRHEFIDGYVYAMAGGTQRHDRIARTITRLLEDHLEGGPCQVFSLNMRVRLANEGDHVYADAAVTCDPRDVADDLSDYIRYPRLVVEVLSDSTEKHDRGATFDLSVVRRAIGAAGHVGILIPAEAQRIRQGRGRHPDRLWHGRLLRRGPGCP